MNLSTAKEKLEKNGPFYMSCLNINWVVKYIAIVKKNILSNNEDNYQIEIGYVHGRIVHRDDEYMDLENMCNEKFRIASLYEEISKDIHEGNVKTINLNERNHDCGTSNIDRKKYSELFSGCSITGKKNILDSGTLGMIFNIEEDNDNAYLLSNFHVLAKKNSKIDGTEEIVQPSFEDVISTERPVNKIGTLHWIYEDKFIDAAIAKIDFPIKQKPNTKCQSFALNGIGTPVIGRRVIKCGRTTGLTSGVIRSIHCTVNIGNKTFPPEEDIKKEQILTTCMSRPGDSGSVLIDTEENKVVGLVFASREDVNATYANNINKIFNSNITHYNNTKLPKITFKNIL